MQEPSSVLSVHLALSPQAINAGARRGCYRKTPRNMPFVLPEFEPFEQVVSDHAVSGQISET